MPSFWELSVFSILGPITLCRDVEIVEKELKKYISIYTGIQLDELHFAIDHNRSIGAIMRAIELAYKDYNNMTEDDLENRIAAVLEGIEKFDSNLSFIANNLFFCKKEQLVNEWEIKSI